MAKTLNIRSISEVAEDAKKYINNRRLGIEKSLKVKSKVVNDTFMNGFDWGRIITVAGIPGSGKSTLISQWIKEFVECNPDEQFDILKFQFEMLGIDEVARDVASKTNKSVKDVYSATSVMSEKDIAEVNKELDKLKDYPIYVVDTAGTVRDIVDTIIFYAQNNNLVEKQRGLIVTLDHTLLVKGDEDKKDEKAILDHLYHALVALKKYAESIKLKLMIFCISQLNRNIESTERITNPKLHYPNKTDIHGASSCYHSSDYVIILHKPALIDGLGNWYGPPRKNHPAGLPVFNPKNDKQAMIYMHVIKERFGSTCVLPMLDELNSSRIADYQK